VADACRPFGHGRPLKETAAFIRQNGSDPLDMQFYGCYACDKSLMCADALDRHVAAADHLKAMRRQNSA